MKMHPQDKDKTTFITKSTNYCYMVMPLGLKNVGIAYQRLMGKIFYRQIGQNVEVYMDDIVICSSSVERHLADLNEVFIELKIYDMKLNLEKCAFGVLKFMGGIEANLNKYKVMLSMRNPAVLKEAQQLMS
ncbi:hypothetical protein Fmac_011551 [Flemingia macrophylla]|uniref:Reverse transcriptase domain-containing protein n=1 Tax=Flemingia macrophylla TaxID=520843 RepID=A0ABD1MMS2_9FABA